MSPSSQTPATQNLGGQGIVSQGEMDAILLGLEQIDPGNPATDGAEASLHGRAELAASARPLDWSRWPRLQRGSLPGLDALLERAVAQWAAQSTTWLGCPVRVDVGMALEHQAIDLNSAPPLPGLADVARHLVWWVGDAPKQAAATLSVDAHVLEAMVERHYGAASELVGVAGLAGPDGPPSQAGAASAPPSAVPSAAVQRVLERWGQGLADALRAACPAGVALPGWRVAACAEAWPAGMALTTGPWVTVGITVNVGGVSGALRWALPWLQLESSGDQWRCGVAAAAAVGPSWGPRLQRLVQGIAVPLQANARVGPVGLQQLANWCVGDVLALGGQVEVVAPSAGQARLDASFASSVALLQARMEGPLHHLTTRLTEPIRRPTAEPSPKGGWP
jgi:flagellar motor switch protein FliM